eukprot:254965-Prorocentrum_minimum.AAC.1
MVIAANAITDAANTRVRPLRMANSAAMKNVLSPSSETNMIEKAEAKPCFKDITEEPERNVASSTVAKSTPLTPSNMVVFEGPDCDNSTPESAEPADEEARTPRDNKEPRLRATLARLTSRVGLFHPPDSAWLALQRDATPVKCLPAGRLALALPISLPRGRLHATANTLCGTRTLILTAGPTKARLLQLTRTAVVIV